MMKTVKHPDRFWMSLIDVRGIPFALMCSAAGCALAMLGLFRRDPVGWADAIWPASWGLLYVCSTYTVDRLRRLEREYDQMFKYWELSMQDPKITEREMLNCQPGVLDMRLVLDNGYGIRIFVEGKRACDKCKQIGTSVVIAARQGHNTATFCMLHYAELTECIFKGREFKL